MDKHSIEKWLKIVWYELGEDTVSSERFNYANSCFDYLDALEKAQGKWAVLREKDNIIWIRIENYVKETIKSYRR